MEETCPTSISLTSSLRQEYKIVLQSYLCSSEHDQAVFWPVFPFLCCDHCWTLKVLFILILLFELEIGIQQISGASWQFFLLLSKNFDSNVVWYSLIECKQTLITYLPLFPLLPSLKHGIIVQSKIWQHFILFNCC